MKRATLRLALTISALGLAASPALANADAAKTESCAAVTQTDIAKLFDRWNSSLATKDPDRVASNYSEDAVLLPTVSNTPRTNTQEIRRYFVDFLQKEPQGKIDTRTIRVGCNTASDVGTYTFQLKGADGKVSMVPARYSYIYELRGSDWKIVHHHSSAMPEKVN